MFLLIFNEFEELILLGQTKKAGFPKAESKISIYILSNIKLDLWTLRDSMVKAVSCCNFLKY